MDKLRAKTNVKTIEVNDAGECIYVDLSDNSFFERFRDFLIWIEKAQADIDRRTREFAEKYRKPSSEITSEEDEADEINVEMVCDVVSLQSEVCRSACAELDKMFGESCCKKVFPGVEAPGFEYISDFLEQIVPLLQKYAEERNANINLKYSRSRKGARSK